MAHPPLETIEAGPAETPGRPPLLLVHGVRHAAWCWEPWQAALADLGWRSVALSLRGHGDSGGSTRGATLKAYVDDIVSVAERFDEPPVLIGHSMGGMLVQRAVHRVATAGLVMVAPAPAHNGLPFAARFARNHPGWFLKVLAGRPLPFEAEDLMSSAVAAPVVASTMARLEGESALVQYQFTLPRRAPAKANVPTLLLATPDDAAIPVPDIERTAQRHGVEVKWYPGLAHDLMLEPSPEPLATLVDWLDQLN